MELRHLRYFTAIVECGSVRGAAERMHITQPAISRQVHDLEEELGIRVFERVGRGLRLTEAGKSFLADARSILSAVEEAKRSAQLLAQGLRGRLRLGAVESAGWDGLVPDAIGRFQKQAPDARIELQPMASLLQLKEIRSGMLDGGFVYLFETDVKDLGAIPLTRQDVMLAVHERSHLLSHPVVRCADLASERFVGFERQVYPAYYDLLMSAAQRAGLTPHIVQVVQSESAVLSLVSAGIGIAFVNGANVARPPARVRFLTLADLAVPLLLSFVWADDANPMLMRFVGLLPKGSRNAGKSMLLRHRTATKR